MCSDTGRLISELESHVERLANKPLRELLRDDARCKQMHVKLPEFKLLYDYSRQKLDVEALETLFAYAKSKRLDQYIEAMFCGEHINNTEDRAVLHVALRSTPEETYLDGSTNVVPLVHNVLNRIHEFSEKVRSGVWRGATNKILKNVISVGIGGSYLGPEFVSEAFKTYKACEISSAGRQLKFLANVDPVDFRRATMNLDPEETLVIIVSKTFTTAETMLNAQILKEWLKTHIQHPDVISKHVVAVSSNVEAAQKFGICPENVFEFWDWVGGRFSVTSSVGCLPLAIQYGYEHVESFLKGCRKMDNHFRTADWKENLPVLSGLIAIYNTTFRKLSNIAILPYSQALHRFPAHIQQLTMESLGKGVFKNGKFVPESMLSSEIYFGEPGTNGQHSFYQLIHQGRKIQSEFIGFKKSQHPKTTKGVDSHVELMANFFAQQDALAIGKTVQECLDEGCPEHLATHKSFSGDRVSTMLLLPEADPENIGILLSLYEHRVAVQGFVCDINAFDQWGVELGKQLAKRIKDSIKQCFKIKYVSDDSLPTSTKLMIKFFTE